MGKQRRRATQASMWVATQDLPRSAAPPFYRRLNQILERAAFDAYVERLCRRCYADEVGRPGLAPGGYVRMLLLGYFEGLDSERAIAWRAADSLSVRSFLGLELHAAPPDHSTVSRPRRLIDIETHQAVFTWVLQRLAAANLVKGKTIGIDATTLEANAALRSIVRRDTGAGYEECLTRLAQASGIATPTREDVARRDRQRKHKGSNDDWQHPYDPDAKITKMKDGRTHLAHKAEHAVDLETGAVVAVTVQDANAGDTTTSRETLIDAAEKIELVVSDGDGLEEVVGDKGYHSGEFNWSSQHLDDEVLRWRNGNGDGQTEQVGLRCVRPVARESRGGRSNNGSGRRSPGGCRVRRPLCHVACLRPWVVVGSVRAVGCRRSAWRRRRLVICALRSGRRSQSYARRAPGCATLPVGFVEPRRLSHENCVATRRLEAAVWSIGRRRRSGTATDVPSGRR